MSRLVHVRLPAGRYNGVFYEGVTLTVDRDRGLATVRPLRKRRTFELPLRWLAEAVISQVSKAELNERRREVARKFVDGARQPRELRSRGGAR